jgi:hypothetical protein
MLDLDAIEEMANTYAPNGWVRTNVVPLLAEARAARDVRDEIDRLYEDDRILLGEDERLLRLLATWDHVSDKVTGEASDG